MGRVIGSVSVFSWAFVALALGGAIAGCGSAPSTVTDSGGEDAGPHDVCDPVTLAPSATDECVLALPEGFLPQRVFYTWEDGDVALERTDDASSCGSGAAFYVDSESAPTIATICPDTCAELGARSGTPEILATVCGI